MTTLDNGFREIFCFLPSLKCVAASVIPLAKLAGSNHFIVKHCRSFGCAQWMLLILPIGIRRVVTAAYFFNIIKLCGLTFWRFWFEWYGEVDGAIYLFKKNS